MASPSPREVADWSPLDVLVCGPDGDPLTAGDLRRLFTGSTLTDARLDRLRCWSRIIVSCGQRIVAVATCQKVGKELRVPDVGVDTGGVEGAIAAGFRCGDRDIVNALLDALELMCLAGGCERIIVSPPKVSQFFLQRRGYARVNERCAGGWVEKTVG